MRYRRPQLILERHGQLALHSPIWKQAQRRDAHSHMFHEVVNVPSQALGSRWVLRLTQKCRQSAVEGLRSSSAPAKVPQSPGMESAHGAPRIDEAPSLQPDRPQRPDLKIKGPLKYYKEQVGAAI